MQIIYIAAFMLCWFGLNIPRYAKGYVVQGDMEGTSRLQKRSDAILMSFGFVGYR